MASKKSMSDLVTRVCDLLQATKSCQSVKGGRPKLFPPANDKEIRAAEEKYGWKFPPSYVEFLKVTNGLVGYDGVFTFIGVSGKETDKALREIKKCRKMITEEWQDEHGSATDSAIAAFEKKMNLKKETEEEAHVYAGNKLIFGADFFNSIYYFVDRPGKGKDSAVVWRDNQGGIVFDDNFRAMLEKDIKILENRLKDMG